jgi:hypothetical protein
MANSIEYADIVVQSGKARLNLKWIFNDNFNKCDKSNKRTSKYLFEVPFLPVLFNSSQMQSNPNPGQLWMSYSNDFARSSPKLVSKEDTPGRILTAGKRRSTVGLIGIF